MKKKTEVEKKIEKLNQLYQFYKKVPKIETHPKKYDKEKLSINSETQE